MRQTPDIIVDVYTEHVFSGDYRLGYVRLSAKECFRKQSKPQWYRLKSPFNESSCPGIILMNVQYVAERSDVERFPKPRSQADQTYKFFAQILNGFEIAPSMPVDSLNTKVEIRIGASAAN
mmetsp:Transcript_3156/g.3058  ORF Transcript_3156/g.3058 Transcript_3156/m.3058 type:complete len:121 (+) Transcript_3156:405-767(+)